MLGPKREALPTPSRLTRHALYDPRLYRPEDQGEESSAHHELVAEQHEALTASPPQYIDIYCVNTRNH